MDRSRKERAPRPSLRFRAADGLAAAARLGLFPSDKAGRAGVVIVQVDPADTRAFRFDARETVPRAHRPLPVGPADPVPPVLRRIVWRRALVSHQ